MLRLRVKDHNKDCCEDHNRNATGRLRAIIYDYLVALSVADVYTPTSPAGPDC